VHRETVFPLYIYISETQHFVVLEFDTVYLRAMPSVFRA